MKNSQLKLIFIILLQFACTSIFAEGYWIVSPTNLYETPSRESHQLGILVRGAYVDVLSSNINATWIKVKVDNTQEGYIKSSFIQDYLSAYDIYTETPAPIIDDHGYYGSPHMFITVATLKGRSEPNKNAEVKKILTTGQPVSIYFYPTSSDEWVNIGGSRSDYVYVQEKYLGERPVFEDYVAQYEAFDEDDIANRKKIAERAYELAWNSNKYKETANAMLLSVAKSEENTVLVEKLELESLILENTIEIEDFPENSSLQIVINNIAFKYGDSRFSDIQKALGKVKKVSKIDDECCYVGDTEYTYEEGKIVVSIEDDIYDIVSLDLQHPNVKLILNGFELDANTSEEEFIKSSKAIDYYRGFEPNRYSLYVGIDWAAVTLDFKNGVPNELNIFVYP